MAIKIFTSEADVRTVIIQIDLATLAPLVLRMARDITEHYLREDIHGMRAEAELIRKLLLQTFVNYVRYRRYAAKRRQALLI